MTTQENAQQQEGSSVGSLDLLRHGATEGVDIFRGRVEDPLSQTGWEQMRLATQDGYWQRIISSPLGRCREFAVHLGIENGCDVDVDPRLQEYHFGDWDGKRYDEVMNSEEDAVKAFFDDPFSHTPPGGERFKDFNDRVVEGYQFALKCALKENVIVITHGGVILSILAELLGLDRVHGRIDVPYACITTIKPGAKGLPARLLAHGAIC